jgi:hypothetical protein
MTSVFWDMEGILLIEWYPQGPTINRRCTATPLFVFVTESSNSINIDIPWIHHLIISTIFSIFGSIGLWFVQQNERTALQEKIPYQ